MAHVLAFEAEFLFKMLLTGRQGWRCHRAETRRREGGSDWYSTEPTPVPPYHATALQTTNHAPRPLCVLAALPATRSKRPPHRLLAQGGAALRWKARGPACEAELLVQ